MSVTLEVMYGLVSRLNGRTGCSTEEGIDLLEQAKLMLLNRLFPFLDPLPMDLSTRYCEHQLNIAEYLFNKKGAEGQLSHSENGMGRTYASAFIPEEYFIGVIPYGKVL